jgi:nucleotide-binding universal stress UspA family protein
MKTRTNVVVGFDGTPTGEGAVDWAAHEADRRGANLRIVTANPHVVLPYAGLGAGPVPPLDNVELAESIVGEGRLRATKVLDESLITTVAASGHAAAALVRESRDASVVVVGHPARGKAREYITGSVAFAVAAHADCDVAVIPKGSLVLPAPDRPVVVGIDGAPDGERAARRAAEAALRWGSPLEIVRAWQLPTATGWTGSGPGLEIVPADVEYFEKVARGSVEATAAAVRQAFPEVTVRAKVVEDHPVSALLGEAENAGLLVVGTRGLGGFQRIILGSVSRAVIHYAETPVLVVRP